MADATLKKADLMKLKMNRLLVRRHELLPSHRAVAGFYASAPVSGIPCCTAQWTSLRLKFLFH